MIGAGDVVFFFGILCLFTFFIGLAFRTRGKVIRYILHSISGALLIFIVLIIWEVSGKTATDAEREKEVAGDFQLVIDSSRFHGYNLNDYANLTLRLNIDNTITFTPSNPFFNSAGGKWKIHDDGDISVFYYSFDGDIDDHSSEEIWGPDTLWFVYAKDLIMANEKDRLCFKRK